MNSPDKIKTPADIEIRLEHQPGCSPGYFGELSISHRSMSFRSRWNFEVGTQLAVCVLENDGVPVLSGLVGMVVDCERVFCRSAIYEVTLLFVDRRPCDNLALSELGSRPELVGYLN